MKGVSTTGDSIRAIVGGSDSEGCSGSGNGRGSGSGGWGKRREVHDIKH